MTFGTFEAMRLTFRLALDTADGQRFEEKLVLGAWTGEKTWHLVLKLLAYVLFYEQRPRIEEGIGWHFKPDLVTLDDRGAVALWVDCGNISPRKIERVATKVGGPGRFFILKRQRREAERLRKLLDGKIKHPDRVHLLAFDVGVVDALGEALDGTNRLSVRRGEDRIGLDLENRRGRRRFETSVLRVG
ncbi:MAG: YaeQ family protein [Acidobacteriota bacterium]